MDLKVVEKIVGQIERTLFRNSNYYSVGMLKSHFKGTGLQFKEHQIYTHGDDVRFIDWKLLARSTVPYIKTFEEERNVEIVVLVDLNCSMLLGHEGVSKLQASLEILSLLYLLAEKTKDQVKAILVGDEIKVLPNKTGKAGIVLLVGELQRMGVLTEEGNINLTYGQQARTSVDMKRKAVVIKKYLARKKEVVILSDFNEFIPTDQLKRMIYNKNLHCFQILCPLDEADHLPFALFGFHSNDIFRKKKLVHQKALINSEKLQNQFGPKFKKLSVAERYLENFVKEML